MTLGRQRGFVERYLIPGIPYAWIILFFVAPLLIVIKISLSGTALTVPPYEPVFDVKDGFAGFRAFLSGLGFDNYRLLLTDVLYVDAYVQSLGIAGAASAAIMLTGYPVAYGISRMASRWQPILVALIALPFLTSFLIRIYAWIGILRPEGVLNTGLAWLGIIDPASPPHVLNTAIAVFIVLVYSYLPFFVLPVYATLQRIDKSLLDAALDLGATRSRAFWRVTFPLSLHGVVAGGLLVFIPMTGEFVIPDLLGGSDSLMIGKLLSYEFFSNRDWPLSSAFAVILLMALIPPLALIQRRGAIVVGRKS